MRSRMYTIPALLRFQNRMLDIRRQLDDSMPLYDISRRFLYFEHVQCLHMMQLLLHDIVTKHAHLLTPRQLAAILPIEKLIKVLSEDEFVGVFLNDV